MSFKQLLKKGTLGDLRERVSPDRDPSASGSVQASEFPSAPARSTRVLYVTGDARESRIVSGAFSHTHPHLEFDLSVDINAARAHVSSANRHDALVVGWSLTPEDAFALIGYAREQGSELPIIAAAEQSLDLYRQAGADECVRKGGSFLSRLPIAIEDAIKKRPARPQTRTFSPGVASLRVAFAGNLQHLTTALEGQLPPLDCVDLQDTLKDADLQASAPPFDIVLIEHGGKSSVAIADVRARNLEVAIVLLVDPADERGAYETFGASIDDYVAKTSDWPTRLQLRLTAARTRYQQTRELAALRVKEARLRSLVEKLPACIARVSADGLVLATNDRAVSLLGASNANQFLRKPFDVMVGDEGREAWTDFLVRVCAGETRSTEVSITTLSGVSRVLEVTAVPSPVEFGRSPSALMVLRDATDRKRLEEAVQLATELAVEPAHPEPDVDVELDAAAPVDDFEPEPDVEAPVAVVARSHRPLRDLEVDLHRISGTARATFQELGTLLRDAESQHDAALSRQADEYARLKAIELEHFRFYESFIQAASHGVFRATPEGRLLDVNPSLAAVLGYDAPSDVLAASDSIEAFMDASMWTDAVARWRGGSSEPFDTRWLSRERQVLTLRMYGRVIASPGGDGECLEVVAENVSAHRALEGQLRRARRWEDVARITSGIAADLTHVVEAVTASNDLETMQREAAKAVALSRQLVAFGRREARDLARLDLNAVVSRMEDVLRRLLDEHIELTLNLGQVSPVLAAQPPIEEALVNLTVAAAELLPAGGRVRIETGTVVVDGATPSAHDGIDQGEYGVISLAATGWGIDAGTRERLLAGGASAAQVGTGYSSAVRALGQSGGGLRLDGADGDSVMFKVYLPLVQRGDS